MKRSVHVHIHTEDASWEESKHPRKDDGKFGTGSGDKKKAATSNADLTQAAHKAYVAATQQGNGTMAAHYLKQYNKYKNAPTKQGVTGLGKSDIPDKERFNAGKGDPVHGKGGSLSEKDKADIKSNATLQKEAKAEYDLANKGKGNFAKAAEMYEEAGMSDKAADARAMAFRYGHDTKGQDVKGKADLAEAAKVRAEMETAPDHVKPLLKDLATVYETRAKDPENNRLTQAINSYKDEIAYESSKKPITRKRLNEMVAHAWNTVPHANSDRKIKPEQAADLSDTVKAQLLAGYATRARNGYEDAKHTHWEISDYSAALATNRIPDDK